MMLLKKIILLLAPILFVHPAFAQTKPLAFHYTSNDSAIAFASNRYTSHSFLHRFFMGKNYRKEWQQPVTLPVFRLSTSGFKIEELGGGMQTKSLKLTDATGKVWALRSVNKDVSGAMPKWAKGWLPQQLSQDLISASAPYGAPVVGALAKALHIAAAQPIVYFVADDTAFGQYRHLFANTLCQLEERDPGFDKTEATDVVLKNSKNSQQFIVNQKVFLKARLLDMLIADWDRHADNWRWGTKDSLDITEYIALPRDRDWAFYQSKGWLPAILRITHAMRFLVNFEKDSKQIKNLSYKAWMLDKTFLNRLTAADWKAAIHEFQHGLTDEVIEDAVKKLPTAIYKMDSTSYVSKLKSRRNSLEENALGYYRFLSKEVQINGTNEAERFLVTASEKELTVTVSSLSKDRPRKLYERTFLSGETFFIIIEALGGDDVFEIAENATSKIRLKLMGGKGNDTYNIKGNVRVKVYENANENNIITKKSSAKIYLQ